MTMASVEEEKRKVEEALRQERHHKGGTDIADALRVGVAGNSPVTGRSRESNPNDPREPSLLGIIRRIEENQGRCVALHDELSRAYFRLMAPRPVPAVVGEPTPPVKYDETVEGRLRALADDSACLASFFADLVKRFNEAV